VHVCTK